MDGAKINWAHIGIAQLITQGYIDRVLTTNFDPLVVRACALLGVFPAVYDFAASQLFKPAHIPDQAIFYLHGQRTGFVLLNTEEEVKKLSELVGPVFQEATEGRVWLVVGYSGQNDSVFGHLARIETFDRCLYWVGYQDAEPPPHVRDRLLGEDRYAFYVNGYDADDFFVTLAQKLACFPPPFASKPFSHLGDLLDTLTPYSIPGQKTDLDVMSGARGSIQKAIQEFEEAGKEPSGKPKTAPTALLARALLLARRPGDIIDISTQSGQSPPPELVEPLSWAYLLQGNALAAQAKTAPEADRLYEEAGQKYEAALRIQPDFHEALYNWAIALADQAKGRTAPEADRV